MRMAWEAIELIYRTVGTSDAAKHGAMIGRIFRNMAVINTHPALQLERIALNAARTRFGLTPANGRWATEMRRLLLIAGHALARAAPPGARRRCRRAPRARLLA